jgi:flagellar biosynthesis chaperone FliJ
MTFPLQTLLDLRRNAERRARQVLDMVVASRLKEEEEQTRLLARWQRACATMASERERLADGASPTTAAQAKARAHYLLRLRDEAARLASIADEHRTTALAMAIEKEGSARWDYEEARHACEEVEKLKQRSDAREKQRSVRRADDAASDLAQARHFRRRSE